MYNRFGQLVTEIDPEGNVADYEHYPENDPDGDGRPTESIRTLAADTGGYQKAIVRDSRSSPRRDATIPLAAVRASVEYDVVGNVTARTDGNGNTTRYEYNALGQVVRQHAPAPYNYITNFYYDANNNLIYKQVQNVGANGPGQGTFVTTRYQYDILDKRISETVQVSASEKLTTRFEYDANRNLVRLIQPEGNVVERVYDERDLVYAITQGVGTADASTRTFTYDGNRNLIRTVDAVDNSGDGAPESTVLAYDGFDRLVSTTDALGNVMAYSYDPAGNRIRERHFGPDGGPSPLDASGTANVLLSDIAVVFDELNREIERNDTLLANGGAAGSDGPLTPGDGKVTSRVEYDRNNRVKRAIDDNNHVTRYRYDGLGRLTRETDALNNVVAYTYDANGNMLTMVAIDRSPEGRVADETFTTALSYDELDRLIAVTDNLGNVTAYLYDSRGNVILEKDPLGNETVKFYDGINRILEERTILRAGGAGDGARDTASASNGDGLIRKIYDWDGNSRLASLTDDAGNVTAYAYDALNRKIQETFADGTGKQYVYDGDGNLIQFTDQNGSVHSHGYDGLNRLVRTTVAAAPGVEGSSQWTYQYDGLSRRTRATDNNDPADTADDSALAFQYDSLNRMLAEVQNGTAVRSQYDGVGNRTAVTYPSGRVVQVAYDAVNRIKAIQDAGSADAIVQYDYQGIIDLYALGNYAGTGMDLDDQFAYVTEEHNVVNEDFGPYDIGYYGQHTRLFIARHRLTRQSAGARPRADPGRGHSAAGGCHRRRAGCRRGVLRRR